MNHRIQPAALQPAGELCRRHNVGELALAEIAPFAVMAERVADGDIGAPGLVEGSHDIRSDKTGATGHQQHSVPALLVEGPAKKSARAPAPSAGILQPQ